MTSHLLTAGGTPATAPRSRLLGGLLLCTALSPLPAFAQTAPAAGAQAAESADNGTQLQDIVVTAQRREEKAQDTPISVAAFNQAVLKAAGVANVTELSHVVPSLNFSGNVGVVYPFLRGIGNVGAGTPGNESSVAMYLDDVYYSRLSPAYLALGDIERVEVLNGPQGTLFGRNSSGGAIQIFTRDPSSSTAMDATIGYANYNTISGNAYLSVPLSSTLSWNIAAAGSDQSEGWGKNIVTGKDAYYQNFVTVRSKLVWEPSADTRVKLVAFYSRTDGDIGNASSVARGTNVAYPNWGSAATTPPGYPVAPALLPSLENSSSTFYDTQLNSRNVSVEHGYGGSLRIDQNVGFADLVSITAFRNSAGNDVFDDDYTPKNFANVFFRITGNDVSQELQLKSKSGSTINWIAGAYYLHNKASVEPVSLTGDALDLTVAPGTFLEYRSLQKLNSYSVFAQATAPIVDQTNLTLGARYTWDSLFGAGTQTLTVAGPGGPVIPLAAPYSGTTHSRAFTYRVALDHHFTSDVMVYASASKGYKSGTFNTVPLGADPNRAEKVYAYELGFKSELMERRVRLNGAVFWNQIKDPQVQVFTTTNGLPSTALVNAKGARTRGGELQLEAVAATGLRLRGAVTYVDATYTDFVNAPSYTIVNGALVGPAQRSATGNRMPDSPEWSFTAGANYTLDFGAGKLVGDVSATHKSSFAWTPDNQIFQGPVTLVNASLNFTPASASWVTIGAWVKNLTNKRYNTLVQGQVFQLGNSEYQAMPGAPRTFGGTVSVKY